MYAVGFDQHRLAFTAPTPVPVLENVDGEAVGAAHFSFSGDGSLVYLPLRKPGFPDRTLVWVDREGREEAVPVEAGAYAEFTLSPDGTRAAVNMFPDVWILDLVRGRRTQLTFDSEMAVFHPTWTSDGRRVVFGTAGVADQRTMGGPMLSRAADGTGTVQMVLEGDGRVRSPQAFSRDGAMMIFSLFFPGELFALAGDQAPTLLWESSSSSRERNADLSPDGRWLAYESNQTGQYEVWVRPFPNVEDGEWQISTDGGMWPLWDTDDGNELLYIGPEGMMTVPVETQPTFSLDPPELLFSTEGFGTPDKLGDNRRMDIAPDGERFLMFKESRRLLDIRPDPILIQNWTNELQRLVPTP